MTNKKYYNKKTIDDNKFNVKNLIVVQYCEINPKVLSIHHLISRVVFILSLYRIRNKRQVHKTNLDKVKIDL